MAAVSTALVVGAGSSGASVATLLAEAGVAVDLVEITPDVTALGSGITLQGNALRVLDRLGVLDACIAEGYPFTHAALRAPDAEGTVLAEIQHVPTGGPEVPPVMGMYRPDLARILVTRAERAGVKVRFSTTVESLTQDTDGVDVRLSDGTVGRYGMVVGADGVRSSMRGLLNVPLETRPVGMGIWRIFAPRPARVERSDLFYGGPLHLAGYTPTGDSSLYAYLVEDAQDRSGLSPAEQLEIVRELSAPYHGPWDDIRASLGEGSRINYTRYQAHLLDMPWNRGRVVLIGDAVHVCPPSIAQGAAMGFEDAQVLAEMVAGAETLDDAFWEAFAARRFDRVKAVVDASVQICSWSLEGVPGDVPGLMSRIAELVSRPA
jgi:2-polyprenyl-6-methoxyphenol hydroxylase-like FAD-dependent oxidoreductase